MTDLPRVQAVAQRRNLLNIIRELETDRRRISQHIEALRREVTRIETEHAIGTSMPTGDTQPIVTSGDL